MIEGSPADKIGISPTTEISFRTHWDYSSYGAYNLNCFLGRLPMGTVLEIDGNTQKSGSGPQRVYPVRVALGKNPFGNPGFPSDAKLIELKGEPRLEIHFEEMRVAKLDDGPGKRAGIKAGDVFLTIDGIDVKDVNQITKDRDEVFQGKRSYATILIGRRHQRIVYRMVKIEK